jgi:hypothetical protein
MHLLMSVSEGMSARATASRRETCEDRPRDRIHAWHARPSRVRHARPVAQPAAAGPRSACAQKALLQMQRRVGEGVPALIASTPPRDWRAAPSPPNVTYVRAANAANACAVEIRRDPVVRHGVAVWQQRRVRDERHTTGLAPNSQEPGPPSVAQYGIRLPGGILLGDVGFRAARLASAGSTRSGALALKALEVVGCRAPEACHMSGIT